MIKRLTFGFYEYKDSSIHNLDPRLKLFYILALSTLIFITSSFGRILLFSAFFFSLMLLARMELDNFLGNLRPFYFAAIFILIMYALFSPSKMWQGILAIWRLLMLAAVSMVFTYTTKISDIVFAIEKMLNPLKLLGIKPRNTAMMISVAIRFLPSFFVLSERLKEAMLSRLADFRKAKNLKIFVLALFERMLKTASNLSDALYSKLYHENIESPKRHLEKNDYLSIVVFLVILAITY